MASERSGAKPVGLTVVVNTDWGAKRATVPIDATVGDFVNTVVASCGIQISEESPSYTLEAPIRTDDGWDETYQVDRYELLVDALRGVQKRPKIVPIDS